MKKIAFVVQRYGLEVNGGAELECRQFAEKLKNTFDITVLTTCAVDYMSWKNEYSAGEENINDVRVKRFSVDQERDVADFNKLSEIVFEQNQNLDLSEDWMKKQGPFSSGLLDYIRDRHGDYECFVFFTYLYATTYFALPLIKGPKRILFPEAHDEKPIYLKIFDNVFSNVDGLIYNTEEEKDFVESRFDVHNTPSIVTGMGVELPKDEVVDGESFKRKYKLDKYVLYAGRIDESKGCKELFRDFLKYRSEFDSEIKLVLLGKEMMKVPKDKSIIPLGFVSEKDKFDGIMGSEFVVVPSKQESLSIILLESFLCKKTVLVNGASEVLKGHCLRSNGGLWYDDESEFLEAFRRLDNDQVLCKSLGANGYDYVTNKYNWDSIIPQVSSFLMS